MPAAGPTAVAAAVQVVGILSLFVWPAPMTLKQGYLTCTGVIVAYVFTWVPQWTTWTLLAAMAIYDLFAVLSPGGPLKARPSRSVVTRNEGPCADKHR